MVELLGIWFAACSEHPIRPNVLVYHANLLSLGVEVCKNLTAGAWRLICRGAGRALTDQLLGQDTIFDQICVAAFIKESSQFLSVNILDRWHNMDPRLELELYQHLVAYLCGGIQLRDFRQWFDVATWDQQPWTSALVGSTELAMAEYLNKDRTEGELKMAFSEAVSNATIPVPASSQVRISTESESEVKTTPTWGATVRILGSPFARLHATESV